MGQPIKRTKENPFYKARIEASKWNETFKSREGAAEALGIHPSTLANYELGTRCNPQPDVVIFMADLYNAPELLHYFCSNECPIGHECKNEVDLCELDRLTVKAITSLKDVEEIKDGILEIAEDGQVTDDEWVRLDEIVEKLKRISRVGQELELFMQKNRRE